MRGQVVGVDSVGGAATVGTREGKVGEWWVQIAPLAGIRGSCLNFSKGEMSTARCLGRTLVAFLGSSVC
jgi:hypothetical protein